MYDVVAIYDLPIVANVCEQELRELWRTPFASQAHVVMQPGAISLLHEHSRLTEVYHILEGEGVLFVDGQLVVMTPDTIFEIPPGVAHKLFNTGPDTLVHLVTCMPPFDPTDVILIPEEGNRV